jgi:replicative DNA helicase
MSAVQNKAKNSPAPDQGPILSPEDHDLELALLACILSDNTVAEEHAELISPDYLTGPRARILTIAIRLIDAAKSASATTIAPYLKTDPDFVKMCGDKSGVEYLDILVSMYAWRYLPAVEDLVRQVRDLGIRRGVMELLRETAREASQPAPEDDAEQILDRAETALAAMRGGREAKRVSIVTLAAAADEAMSGDRAPMVRTHYVAWDDMTRGLAKKELSVLGARPGMGKTALAACAAFKVAESGEGVLFVSLEMPRAQLAARLLAWLSGVPLQKIQDGDMNAGERADLAKARKRLDAAPFYIEDQSGMTAGTLCLRIRRHVRRNPTALVVIDHLSYIVPSRRDGNTVQDIADTTRQLKAMAKSLDVAVLLLAQLNRAVEQREDKRPNLADLRDSGAIEQDAFVVMFLFREEYYLEKSQPTPVGYKDMSKYQDALEGWQARLDAVKNQATLIVAKNRQGPCGDIPLEFNGRLTAFSDVPQRRTMGRRDEE